ncbi:MAG TPA: 8-amino-7-oxononanoate synthase [Phycisphaerales bacterium]|nr:8-amino-7-oxononanoate synthase [Phycisphaerales bacterium]HCD30826.1 8-amino-7-oxononanoate synthase [Phycisphaerales bacterium]|tara:strand:- start:519 stop:1694 length:1176 start_codon:yes stop_codon:yes gene_type:complete
MDLNFSKPWLDDLKKDLDQRQSLSLYRQLIASEQHGPTLVRDGRKLLNLAGNDYLGLGSHPDIKAAAINAIQNQGIGSGASKLVTGHSPQTTEMELEFAAFKHAQAALLFPTGYMANLGVITSLAGDDDVILIDKLTHASLIDAARSSSATVRVFPHGNMDKLARLLERNKACRRRLIVTDSVFSMDGDVADLPAICDLAKQYDAITIVDEAHGTGVLGEHGSGLCELQNVQQQIDVVISTASKAMGSLGGIVTANRIIIDTLINNARSLIYTTAPPPSQVASIQAAIKVIKLEPWRRQRVTAMSKQVRDAVKELGYALPECDVPTPIIPLITGSAEAAVQLSEHLNKHGIHAPAIRPPTVAPNSSRVRISLRCDLTDEHVSQLMDALKNT